MTTQRKCLTLLLLLALVSAPLSAQVPTLRVVMLGNPATPTSVASGTSVPINIQNMAAPSVWIRPDGGTISAGVLTIEEADFDGTTGPYTGTWSLVTTVDLTTLSTLTQQQVTHLQVSGYAYIRVRISTAITGGGKINVVLRARN